MDNPPFAAQPLVSVLVPAFNGARYVVAALESLQRQDHRHLEIIVIDDASTDDTVERVEGLIRADGRILLVKTRNRSIAASRNEGLARARGVYVSFLDQDDLCPPGKIARQVARLASKPNAMALFGRTLIFASDETTASNVRADDRAPAFTMCLSAALFRRSVFDRVGPLDPKFRLADDLDLILRVIEADLTVEIEDDLATLHRRHAAQATADLEATRREALLALAESLRRRRAAGKPGCVRHPLLAAVQP